MTPRPGAKALGELSSKSWPNEGWESELGRWEVQLNRGNARRYLFNDPKAISSFGGAFGEFVFVGILFAWHQRMQ